MALREPSETEKEQARIGAKTLREVMGTAWEMYISGYGGVRLAGIGDEGEIVLAAPEQTAGACHTYAGKWIPQAIQQSKVQIRWATQDERRAAWAQ